MYCILYILSLYIVPWCKSREKTIVYSLRGEKCCTIEFECDARTEVFAYLLKELYVAELILETSLDT